MVATTVDDIVSMARADAIGVRALRVPDDLADATIAPAERALLSLGYVTMPVVEERSRPVRASLVGRHVALICRRGDDPATAAWWIRWLGRSSPRGHVVVIVGEAVAPGLRASRDAAVRERAPLLEPLAAGPTRNSAWVRRAEACCRRRRFAAAQRWFQAALVAAERRGDQAMAHQAARRLADLLAEQADARAAWQLAIDLAERVATFTPRAGILAAGAAALVTGGELDRAEALVAALEAEADVLEEELPTACLTLRSELTFWRGRFDRARHPLAAGSVEEAAWCGLAAWARGDLGTVGAAIDEIGRRAARGESADLCVFWQSVLAWLTVRDESAAVVPPLAASRRLVLMASVVSAEGWLARGRLEQARAELARLQPTDRFPEAWAHAWLRARCDDEDDNARRALETRLRREGVDGVLRWGEGKDGMHLIHGLPALLQLAQDADDDQAALSGGCTWVRRQTGVEGVAIVDADRTGVLASEGWIGPVTTEAETRSVPVRYGRVVIAHVLARGSGLTGPAVEPALHAVAALLGSAVRARLDALALSREAHRAAPEILGTSPGIAAVREAIARASLTPFPVLIEGESGTGKELVARAVHRLSARRDRPFAAVNCAALTDDLFEAELFGHARGAFTGALGTRTGLFEWADGGTLFLDEVGELSPRGQAKLLRALQEREIRRVGENIARAVDVRVVAATNVALAEAAVGGLFRQDLLFRLAVVRIRVPPLRDRLEDVPLLARAFFRQFAAERGPRARLGPDALASLCRYAWPGNVRELQNVVASLVVAVPGHGRVTERHVRQVLAAGAGDPGADQAGDAGLPLTTARLVAERRAVAAALARHGGRRAAAAMELGLSRQGLTKVMRRLGLGNRHPDAGVA
jgi:DNA-binding NtrC family response regulator